MPAVLLPKRLSLLSWALDFRLLFAATLGSGFGTYLAAIALTVDVYDRTGSGTWVAALLIVDFLPMIAVGLLLGPFVDRFSRRGLMIGSDLLRLAVFCALPFADSPLTLVILAGVAGLATGFFRPAVYAGLPNLVPDEELANANSLLQGVENLAWMVGPVIGGAILALSTPDTAYWINAATFLISVVLLLRIPARRLRSEEPLTRGHWHDLAEGYSVVRHSRALMTVLVVWNIVFVGTAAVNVAEVVVAKVSLDSGNLGFGPARRRVGTRAHARQPLGERGARAVRDAHALLRLDRGDGRGIRGGRDRSDRLGGGAAGRRRRGRERVRARLQRAARPARRARPGARPRLHDHHELELRPLRPGDGGRGPADGPRRRPLDVGRRRGGLPHGRGGGLRAGAPLGLAELGAARTAGRSPPVLEVVGEPQQAAAN